MFSTVISYGQRPQTYFLIVAFSHLQVIMESFNDTNKYFLLPSRAFISFCKSKTILFVFPQLSYKPLQLIQYSCSIHSSSISWSINKCTPFQNKIPWSVMSLISCAHLFKKNFLIIIFFLLHFFITMSITRDHPRLYTFHCLVPERSI